MLAPLRPFALAIALSTIAPLPPHAATIRVPTQQPTIQQGINAAVNGDTVLVAPGTYTGANNRNLSFLNKDLVLKSEQGPATTTIDCQSLGRGIILFDAESPLIRGLTVKNGAAVSGAGLSCVGAQPELRNCIFRNNVATERGGGLSCLFSSVTLDSCQFINNHAPDGGAIVTDNALSFFYDCRFERNQAQGTIGSRGGAVLCGSGSGLRFFNCLFNRNSASDTDDEGNGGAIFISPSGHAELHHCTLYGNHASAGPTHGGHGGGLFVGGQATLENTIIAFGTEGEAVFCSPGTTVTADCCDVFGNDGGDWVGCIAGLNGIQGNISADPGFCGPENDNFRLAASSPCAPDHSPGECGLIGAFGVDCASPLAIADPERVPTAILRISNHPNPFKPSTTIVYELPAPGLVTLTVFDVSGRWVRGLVTSQPAERGEYRIAWDGTDDAGRPVESGVYFGHLRIGGNEEVRRLVLLR